jgi:hypothetical protein
MTDWSESVLFPIFSQVFFGGDGGWRTDKIMAAVFRAIAQDSLDVAVEIMLEVLDVDEALLRDTLIATGRYHDDNGVAHGDALDVVEIDVTEVIDTGINDLTQQNNDLLEQILRTVIQGNIDQGAIWERTAGKIVTDIISGQAGVGDTVSDILGGIVARIDDSRGTLGKIWDFIRDKVDVHITNNIVIPSDVFEAVVGGIADILDGERGFFEGILGVIRDTFRQLLGDIINREMPELVSIADAIKAQTATEEVADDAMLDEVQLINDDTIEGTGASLVKSAGLVIEEGINRSDVATADEWFKGFTDDVFIDCTEQDLEDWIKQKGLIDGVSGKIVYEIMQVVGKALGLVSIGSALATKELYEFSRCTPWEILEPGDAIVAYQRGLLSLDNLIPELRMRGYNEERVDTLIESGYQIPDPASLYAMNLRGLAPGQNLTKRFEDLGFNPEDAEGLAELKFYIPGPADLITMAVRDVFNPEVVAAFKQDEDFPEDFEYWAKQQGISSDWAHKYWQAHWVLPSIQMAFEMLHRRVIDETKLRQLMAAQDIIPGWRDELIAISYSPYTRVDIRRMHDVGVLTEAEVFRAYQDIGYDTDKAQTLTDFTIRLNSDDPDDIEPLDGLTRSAVIRAFKDGIIDRPTAEQLLTAEGVGTDAALIYLTTAEMDIEAELRKDSTETILAEFSNGAISLREAERELRILPLTPLEVEKAELKLRRLVAVKTKQPSKADLSKMYKEGIIGRPTFEQQMLRLGYSQFWVDEYVNLIKLGITPDDEPTP